MAGMLEKAEAAVLEALRGEIDPNEARIAVRAALLAIREPSPSLFANPDARFVGFAQIGDEPEENVYLESDEAAAAFKSTIDAILNEKPETGTT